MDVLTKVPVREQDAKERAINFDEVCLGYNKEEAMNEAARCINCMSPGFDTRDVILERVSQR